MPSQTANLPSNPPVKVEIISSTTGKKETLKVPIEQLEPRRSGRASAKPIPPPESSNESPEDSLSLQSGSSATVKKEKKKRGRKLTEFNKYQDESKQKISELQELLRRKGKQLNAKERQKIRNQISAQQSRLKKKEEFRDLDQKYD